MPALWELQKEYDDVYQLAINESDDGELSSGFIEKLSDIEDTISNKLSAYVRMIKNLQSDHNAYKTESDRMKKKADSLKKKVDWLKGILYETMIDYEIKETEGIPHATIMKNSRDTINVEDFCEIPDEFLIVQQSRIDKNKIYETIKNGGDVPGVNITRGSHIRIT